MQLTTPNTRVALHYRTWGTQDAPPLVLLHGLASTSRIWDLTAPILADHYYALAYDQRGHALSAKPDDGYDLPTMLADLLGFLDALGIDKPILAGHSWGANLALAFAASYSDRCAGLSLIDGGLSDFQDIPGTTLDTIKRDLAPTDLSRFTLPELVSRIHKGVLSDLPLSFVEEYACSIMEVQPDGTIRARLTFDRHLAILRIIYDMRTPDLLPRVQCPLSAIQAVGDPKDEREATFLRMKEQGAVRAQTLLPHAKIVQLENTIHDIPLHRPEKLAHEMLDFFKGCNLTSRI